MISLRVLRAALLACGSATVAAGAAVEALHHLGGRSYPVTSRLSLSYESNVPTWYSSALLLCCALALAAMARTVLDRTRRDWTLLAAVFAIMSLDEAAQLHELFNDTRTMGGIFFYAWVVPGIVVVCLLGLRFLPFFLRLRAPLRRRVFISGAVYVGGALVMELLLGWWSDAHGQRNLGYALIDLVEEAMEIAGASLFLYAVAAELARSGASLTITEDDTGDTRDTRDH